MQSRNRNLSLTLALALLGAGLAWRANARLGRRGTGRPMRETDTSDSPNAAERLRATHDLGVGAGIGQSLPSGDAQTELFDTRNAEGDEIVPGLPDQFRGA